MNALVTITDNAAAAIAEKLEAAPEGTQGLRLFLKKGGCAGMEYDMAYVEEGADTSADDRITHGNAVLFIPKMDFLLMGTTIDFATDPLGNSGFQFQNPNVTGACGCGVSVTFDPHNSHPPDSASPS